MRSSPPGPTIRPRRASTVGGIYGSHRDSSARGRALDRGRCRVHVPLIESALGDAAVRRRLGFGYGYRHGLRGPVVQRSRRRCGRLQALAPRGEVRDRRREDGRVRVAGREQPGAEGRPGGDGALRSPRPGRGQDKILYDARCAASVGPPPALRAVRRSILLLALCAALLFGCEGGTLSNFSQNCTSTNGLLAGPAVMCSGEAESLSGSVGIEFGDQDDEEEELSGTYRLSAEISVQSGEARVYSYDADGEWLPLGPVSAGSPLRVEEVLIEPFGESSVLFVDAGEGEVGGLRYKGRIEPA